MSRLMVDSRFLPASREEMLARGWQWVDIVLVTGDAYVDHPSFGVALIGRWLEAHGFRVAILAQPGHHVPQSFREFGRPRLFFGITGGNLDSIVANYSSNAKVREEDDFSPDGNPYFDARRERSRRRRPDRAVILYANLARGAYRETPIILGGLEASLRRFVHFDFQQNKLRGSVLTDAKADLLVYGMGERAVLEIAGRLARHQELSNIPGTCERLSDSEVSAGPFSPAPLILPSWQELQHDRRRFMEAELAVDRHARSGSGHVILQRQQTMWIAQHRPAPPLTTAELDTLYDLPFVRTPHPLAGDVPAYRMIRHSVTILRGCYGNCSFCAITRHQGNRVVSRSRQSICAEIGRITAMDDFHGTITDLGGPTANMYATSCTKSACRRQDCLYPRPCRNLQVDEESFLQLLADASMVKGVRHLYISSGLRMELLLKTPRLLQEILSRHTPGSLKIAPEHTESELLRLMHKPGPGLLPRFLQVCRAIGKEIGKPVLFTSYLISAHPGCRLQDMKDLAVKMEQLGLQVRQFQDFTPTPGTLSTAMYVSGLDRDTLHPLFVPANAGERRAQRLVLEKSRRVRKTKR